MKQSLTCPKCDHQCIWVVDCVESGSDFAPMTLAKRIGGKTFVESVGLFQAVICAQCGYTEFYAYDLANLEYLARDPTSGVRYVDANAGKQPYR